ncbi:MAG: carbamoyltransferase HypF [Lachnospiraceae bacterium]|nr:carbamoyltransferase HypF [Lachnospiraceae bacterium]
MIGNTEKTLRIKVYGIVQGVGFRPTVARHAAATGIRGSVCNKGPYVEIFAQGGQEQVDCFLSLLEKRPPERAAVLKMDVKSADSTELSFTSFEIIESAKTKGEIFISPDIAICDECRKELLDPKDRRYLHPFINCTCCGPRLTILEGLPYDRVRTSMKMFPMCPACDSEYHSPKSRRYDAQPVCCNKCGPEVYLAGEESVRGSEAITRTRRIIAEGGIAAVKGIGGFHLCCDATNEEAVAKLRLRKTRPVKPFAVMMRDEAAVERECEISEAQREILTGHQKPILLLQRREGGRLCPSIAPGNPTVGVMLPYAPVQILLFDYPDGISMPDCLVMTSGNVSGAPICRDDKEALSELGSLCDCILSHNRKIRIRADDSVMDFYGGEPYMIRRSRGYAPLPYMLSAWEDSEKEAGGTRVLAIGGELKNTFCIGTGSLFYPSSYIGDLADLRSVKALEETTGRYANLLEVTPEIIACDLHPRYNSVTTAVELSEKIGKEQGKDPLPVVRVQHHYAHVLSCMAENDFSDPVIGVSMDGTGYGTDGTIWGGEILTADYHGFVRDASIKPFIQVGGDLSSTDGWRIAVSMLHSISREEEEESPLKDALALSSKLALCTDKEASVLMKMADRRLNAVVSTSAGRLFDAVSAICGICRHSTFEGEASMALEFAAERYEKAVPGCRNVESTADQTIKKEEGRRILPTDEIVRRITLGKLRGEEPDSLAWLFHKMLADQIISACAEIREEKGIRAAALSGGCFQNRLLLDMVKRGLEAEGFDVLIHHLVPPNDGGIALGQAAAAVQAVHDGKVNVIR